MRFARYVSLLVVGILAGCKTVTPNPVVDEGFLPFATPRSFDGPGTIFRKNSAGQRIGVETLKLTVSEGTEELPAMSSTRTISASQLLESIGAKAEALPANIKANLSRTTTATLEAVTGKRRQTNDAEVNKALLQWAKSNKPANKSVYFLVRETIATDSLTYSVSSNWLADAGLDLKVLNSIGYNGTAEAKGGNTTGLDKKFSQRMNVWYIAEEITVTQVLGGAPDQYKFDSKRSNIDVLD